jgi:hypothetical protein
MKKVKMVKVLFILICLLSTLKGLAQDYVVKADGTTVYGKVKYLNFGADQRVQVIMPDGTKNTYSVNQAIAFRMKESTYHLVRHTLGYRYMKLLREGISLNLYAFQQPNQATWDGRYLVKKGGSGLEVPNLLFKKILSQFLTECPGVTARIASGELSKSKIKEIVDQYNICLDSILGNEKIIRTEELNRINALARWDSLEAHVNNLESFDKKSEALEMIAEIKSKSKRGEKIPNFLLDGLKNALTDQVTAKELLDKALPEENN